MNLRAQRRLAANIMKVGEGRVWIDPEQADKVSSAITREEVRKLIREGVIRKLSETGISRGRKHELRRKRAEGRRKGPGSRKGARLSEKRRWMKRIRALRIRLRELRHRRIITGVVYRRLLAMAKGGAFRSSAHLHDYIKSHKLARRR